jgi:hypothetical protein
MIIIVQMPILKLSNFLHRLYSLVCTHILMFWTRSGNKSFACPDYIEPSDMIHIVFLDYIEPSDMIHIVFFLFTAQARMHI